MMKLEEGMFCPLLKKRCIGRECAWMVQLAGTNPNTGEQVNEPFCAISALPMLIIESAKEARQGAAATESMRNEIVKRMDTPPPQDFSGRLLTSLLVSDSGEVAPKLTIVQRANSEGTFS